MKGAVVVYIAYTPLYNNKPLERTAALLSTLFLILLCLSGCKSGEENAAGRQYSPPAEPEETESVALGGRSYAPDAAEVYFEALDPDELAQGLAQLPRFTHLEDLFVGYRGEEPLGEVDLSPIARLPELRTLFLSGEFPSLEALSSCPALEELHLNLGNGQPLPDLPTVRRLYLSQYRNVDWAGVEALPQLEYLYFSEVDTTPDFGRLAGHPTLKTIFICIDEAVTAGRDLSGLQRTMVLDAPETPLPDWLPLPQEELRSFAAQEGREILLNFF